MVCEWCGKTYEPCSDAKEWKQWIQRRFCGAHCMRKDREDRHKTGRKLGHQRDQTLCGHTETEQVITQSMTVTICKSCRRLVSKSPKETRECQWCGDDYVPRGGASALLAWVQRRFCGYYCYEDDKEDRRSTGRDLTGRVKRGKELKSVSRN